ncbi:2-phosphosulfolactate phosphatase [Sporosarcina jiandibaonis]|uniref:2-phosphosulfolactate phosphatase n=1 Tax=Sporosarcina jiandibaonis TaxID=2715535 RepID=UPI001554F2CB|nr:2-phosphosulfolactate phosphatase [Sporosarcina jiandibaonis]
MPKLHVLLTKEEAANYKTDAEIVVVVFDVLLATTTIATVLHHGATEVIPVMDESEALLIANSLQESTTILTGESRGRTIEGFIDPLPTLLEDIVAQKTIVLSTTNGTVAIRNVSNAKRIYAGSLVNVDAVADRIRADHLNQDLLFVCAGSMGRFATEDFYGAGCLIDRIIGSGASWKLSDSATTARLFFHGNETDGEKVLKASATGEMMMQLDLEKDVQFASKQGVIPIVPQYENGKMIVKGDR